MFFPADIQKLLEYQSIPIVGNLGSNIFGVFAYATEQRRTQTGLKEKANKVKPGLSFRNSPRVEGIATFVKDWKVDPAIIRLEASRPNDPIGWQDASVLKLWFARLNAYHARGENNSRIGNFIAVGAPQCRAVMDCTRLHLTPNGRYQT